MHRTYKYAICSKCHLNPAGKISDLNPAGKISDELSNSVGFVQKHLQSAEIYI